MESEEMSFQKCPACNGVGLIHKADLKRNCEVCAGKKIINEQTGLPPADLSKAEVLPPEDTETTLKEIERALNQEEEFTDEEILYYHTDHFDELRHKREESKKRAEKNHAS
jgi:hypothetical protein